MCRIGDREKDRERENTHSEDGQYYIAPYGEIVQIFIQLNGTLTWRFYRLKTIIWDLALDNFNDIDQMIEKSTFVCQSLHKSDIHAAFLIELWPAPGANRFIVWFLWLGFSLGASNQQWQIWNPMISQSCWETDWKPWTLRLIQPSIVEHTTKTENHAKPHNKATFKESPLLILESTSTEARSFFSLRNPISCCLLIINLYACICAPGFFSCLFHLKCPSFYEWNAFIPNCGCMQSQFSISSPLHGCFTVCVCVENRLLFLFKIGCFAKIAKELTLDHEVMKETKIYLGTKRNSIMNVKRVYDYHGHAKLQCLLWFYWPQTIFRFEFIKVFLTHYQQKTHNDTGHIIAQCDEICEPI